LRDTTQTHVSAPYLATADILVHGGTSGIREQGAPGATTELSRYTDVLYEELSQIALERRDATGARRASQRATLARLLCAGSAEPAARAFSERLEHSQRLQQVLGDTLDGAIALLGADSGSIQLTSPDRTTLDVFVHSAAASSGFRAVQSTPLADSQGTPLGVLSTYFSRPHRPTDDELLRLADFARLASAVIERKIDPRPAPNAWSSPLRCEDCGAESPGPGDGWSAVHLELPRSCEPRVLTYCPDCAMQFGGGELVWTISSPA
jgi:hypothetical protein